MAFTFLLGSPAVINFASPAAAIKLTGSSWSFGQYVSNVLSFTLVVAVLILLLYFVWGAIKWMTAGSEQSKVTQARDQMTNAGVGLLVLLASVTIIAFIQRFFNIDIITFI